MMLRTQFLKGPKQQSSLTKVHGCENPISSILWVDPINEVLESMDPPRNFTGLNSSPQNFDAKCNAVDDNESDAALWVAEHTRVQGVDSLGPMFNIDLSH